MVDPKAVANKFLELGERDGVSDITPMKLLKLVYIAHGWHLALSEGKKPLVNEASEAWKYGLSLIHISEPTRPY